MRFIPSSRWRLRLCLALMISTVVLGGCEMTRENTRLMQTHLAASAAAKARQAEAKAREASGDVPAHWRDPNSNLESAPIGEMTVNGRSVLVTSINRGDSETLWNSFRSEEERDKYASLLPMKAS